MTTRSSQLALVLVAAGALGACGTETLPPTNTAGPSPAYVTTAPVVTSVPVVTTAPIVTGTLVSPPPATYALVPGSGTSTVVVAPTRLNSNDIVALLAGNTASGTTSDGQPYYTKFQRDGLLTFHEGANYAANGTWRVSRDGQLCSSLANVNSGLEQCYTLYRSGNGYVYERPDGHPVGNFVVSPGI